MTCAMMTLSPFGSEPERSITPRVQRRPLTRLLEGLEGWQRIRADRVIKENAWLLAAPEEGRDLATARPPHDA
jgi:hypothetical protein